MLKQLKLNKNKPRENKMFFYVSFENRKVFCEKRLSQNDIKNNKKNRKVFNFRKTLLKQIVYALRKSVKTFNQQEIFRLVHQNCKNISQL